MGARSIFRNVTISKLILILCIFSYKNSWGEDYSFNVSAGVGFSDNVSRTETNEDKAWYDILGAGLSITKEGSKVEGKLGSAISIRDYHRSELESTELVDLNGVIKWHISRERLTWDLTDKITQRAINVFSPQSPENTQRTHLYSSGPTLTMAISPVIDIETDARYIGIRYEVSDLDQDRYQGSITGTYNINPTSSLSLIHRVADVRFQSDIPGRDFVRTDSFVQLQNDRARDQLVFEGGKTVIEPEIGEEVEGITGRVLWFREISSTSTFSLSASQQLADAGTLLGASTGGSFGFGSSGASTSSSPGFGSPGDVVTSGTLERKRGDIQLNNSWSATNLAIRATGSEDRYSENNIQDNDRNSGSIAIFYVTTPEVTLSLFGSARKTQFIVIDREDKTTSSGLGLSWYLSKNLSFNSAVSRNIRVSEGLDRGRSYTENRIVGTLRYNRFTKKSQD